MECRGFRGAQRISNSVSSIRCTKSESTIRHQRPDALGLESWPSGRRRGTGNAVYLYGYRGFESLALRWTIPTVMVFTSASIRCFCLTTLLAVGCNRTPDELPAGPRPTESSSPSTTATTPSPSPGSSPSSATAAPSPAQPLRSRPNVEVPSGRPPTTLQTEDLEVGTGAEARAGQRVQVHYTGVSWSTRQQFDSSWDHPERPFSFVLGQRQVIPGWDQGVAGMKVGGRRKLIIPPALGYGERGAGDRIGPNETLVFVVDLIAVN
jgi:peptidylprolyl isomerase